MFSGFQDMMLACDGMDGAVWLRHMPSDSLSPSSSSSSSSSSSQKCHCPSCWIVMPSYFLLLTTSCSGTFSLFLFFQRCPRLELSAGKHLRVFVVPKSYSSAIPWLAWIRQGTPVTVSPLNLLHVPPRIFHHLYFLFQEWHITLGGLPISSYVIIY